MAKKAFTIVELLTVMSIIVLLMSILIPALNAAKKYAKQVKQRGQFHSIAIALDMFNADNQEEYPPSEGKDNENPQVQYCGAMKLAEALVGQDKLGFNLSSKFNENGYDGNGATTNTKLYNLSSPPAPLAVTDPIYQENLKCRKNYLDINNADAHEVNDIYQLNNLTAQGFTAADAKDKLVLCDVYANVSNIDPTGKNKIGMPILYYRANTSKIFHDPNAATIDQCTYDYRDNDDLVKVGIPWMPNVSHFMASSGPNTSLNILPNVDTNFYDRIQDRQITQFKTPYNAHSYILLSAGYDGIYGTADDVYNFN